MRTAEEIIELVQRLEKESLYYRKEYVECKAQMKELQQIAFSVATDNRVDSSELVRPCLNLDTSIYNYTEERPRIY